MAQPDGPQSEPPPQHESTKQRIVSKMLGRGQNDQCPPVAEQPSSSNGDEQVLIDRNGRGEHRESLNPGLIRRISKSVVPGLPRAQTFKRQQSEQRSHLTPVQPDPVERRAVSMDRRSVETRSTIMPIDSHTPRTSVPGLLAHHITDTRPPTPPDEGKIPDERNNGTVNGWMEGEPYRDLDAHSTTSSQYDVMIHDELETKWILNLSMHFKDKSRREKFFVTYRQHQQEWRRVTISLDYRDAPVNSLELDLIHTKYQRDKSAKIYEAIRDSLQDIQFYDTVTNLKLETLEGRLHVHVMEDGNEIIEYPYVSQVQHLGCRLVKERDVQFESHISGFVYKVEVGGRLLIKKEVPGPKAIDEFLYEINALNSLRYSGNVIEFYGVIVDESNKYVKGLLINYADGGSLIDIIYDNCKESTNGLPFDMKERWARQIVQGLADIHESGFVQGDFTLSNIVIDESDNAKIIDINRRGCPVGWEPPEASVLLESNHPISMYIGVKSDLYQLGMVLWAIATEEDEPERMRRPLSLDADTRVPWWYREITDTCLSSDPRKRLSASLLARMFPDDDHISVDDGYFTQTYDVEGVHPTTSNAHVKTNYPLPTSWSDVYHPPRGRSLPSPLPSVSGRSRSPPWWHENAGWTANRNIRPSYSDVDVEEMQREDALHLTPTPHKARVAPTDLARDHDIEFPSLNENGARDLDVSAGYTNYTEPKPSEEVTAHTQRGHPPTAVPSLYVQAVDQEAIPLDGDDASSSYEAATPPPGKMSFTFDITKLGGSKAEDASTNDEGVDSNEWEVIPPHTLHLSNVQDYYDGVGAQEMTDKGKATGVNENSTDVIRALEDPGTNPGETEAATLGECTYQTKPGSEQNAYALADEQDTAQPMLKEEDHNHIAINAEPKVAKGVLTDKDEASEIGIVGTDDGNVSTGEENQSSRDNGAPQTLQTVSTELNPSQTQEDSIQLSSTLTTNDKSEMPELPGKVEPTVDMIGDKAYLDTQVSREGPAKNSADDTNVAILSGLVTTTAKVEEPETLVHALPSPTSTAVHWTHTQPQPRNISAPESNSSPYETTPRSTGCAEASATSPDSLVGIGTGHTYDDQNTREQQVLSDDDFAMPQTLQV